MPSYDVILLSQAPSSGTSYQEPRKKRAVDLDDRRVIAAMYAGAVLLAAGTLLVSVLPLVAYAFHMAIEQAPLYMLDVYGSYDLLVFDVVQAVLTVAVIVGVFVWWIVTRRRRSASDLAIMTVGVMYIVVFIVCIACFLLFGMYLTLHSKWDEYITADYSGARQFILALALWRGIGALVIILVSLLIAAVGINALEKE